MLSLILYEAKVALLLAVFYICYRVLLSRETLHRLNRIVLVGSVLVSFVLPFCVLTYHRTVEVAAGAATPELLPGLSELTQEATGAAAEMPAAAGSQGNWWLIALVLLYVAGIIFCLIRMVFELILVSRIIRSGEKHPQEDGTTLVVIDRDVAPFSWMKWIVLSREDYESGNMHILRHERAHIRLGHARELLFIDILSAMQWFNPVMRILKDDLRAVYEYEADDAVLREGVDIREYQYSLIRKAVSASGYSITNSFNHSILKNRITMMSKSKSSAVRGLRVLYVLPLAGICLMSNAQTVIDYKGSNNPQTNYYASPTEIVLTVIQEGNHADYLVKGEEVSLEKLGQKVLEARGDDAAAFVSIVAETDVKTLVIQAVKEELRKVGVLKVQYTCFPNVKVQRRLDPAGSGNTREKFMQTAQKGDIQIWINSLGKLLYYDGKDTAVSQEDLFARAKKDIEKNNGIAFYFYGVSEILG